MLTTTRPFGVLLRDWRVRRRVSQLALAGEARISTKHLSFLETGRSQPSRDMIMRLAEELEIPLRERNALLAAAGYAAIYPQRPLEDEALAGARAAISAVVDGHMPHPALAVDRHWKLIVRISAIVNTRIGHRERSEATRAGRRFSRRWSCWSFPSGGCVRGARSCTRCSRAGRVSRRRAWGHRSTRATSRSVAGS